MFAKHHEVRRERWRIYGFKNLLVWLIVYLMVNPFLENLSFANLLATTFLTLVLASALYAVSRHTRLLYAGIILLTVLLILVWLTALHIVVMPMALISGLLILYFGFLVYAIARRLLVIRKVTFNAICAALCLYLIMGLLWGSLYAVVESFQPGSFAGNLLNQAENASEKSSYFHYFSFVTLSTLGYGDIIPQTRGAAALCQMEAILGQFFSLVLVARVVGIAVAQEVSRESEIEVASEPGPDI